MIGGSSHGGHPRAGRRQLGRQCACTLCCHRPSCVARDCLHCHQRPAVGSSAVNMHLMVERHDRMQAVVRARRISAISRPLVTGLVAHNVLLLCLSDVRITRIFSRATEKATACMNFVIKLAALLGPSDHCPPPSCWDPHCRRVLL